MYVELALTERPRLEDVRFIGIKKGEKEDLEAKTALAKDRVVTDNMKVSAVDAIRRFYSEKSYRNVTVTLREEQAKGVQNGLILIFDINKGNKVKVNSINIAGNEEVTDGEHQKADEGYKRKIKVHP